LEIRDWSSAVFVIASIILSANVAKTINAESATSFCFSQFLHPLFSTFRLYQLPFYQKIPAIEATWYCIVACELLSLSHQSTKNEAFSIKKGMLRKIIRQ
jgi:hypothetical protein